MPSRLPVVLILSLVTTGCTAATWEAIAAGAAAAAAGPSAANYAPGASGKLMLFGGKGHDVYLGCLNCNKYASDSVLNEYGLNGSSYQPNSIFNDYGQFGSEYSPYSACNDYSADPPVIVDSAGKFYGRLTTNAYHPQRTSNTTFLALVALACAK